MLSVEKYKTNFYESLLLLDKLKASEIFEEFLSNFSHPHGVVDAIENIITPAMEETGKGWENDTLSLSQVYMMGNLCESLVDQFLSEESPERKDKTKLAIAVFEDYHLLGKKLVYSTLRANGFRINDYGNGLQIEDIIARVKEDKPDALLISTLMLSSALHIKSLIEHLPSPKPKIIVGGAPFLFDPELWQDVGADAMGSNSSEAVSLVNQITRGEI